MANQCDKMNQIKIRQMQIKISHLINRKIFLFTIFFLFLFLQISNIYANIKLPSIFADNMVLQQNFEAPVWGWAEPGTEVVVSGNWSRMPARSTIADKNGNWMVKLKTIDAGGPYQLSINDIIIQNVMIGEVWICSGQSNMQWALSNTENAEQELMKSDLPSIRLFYVARDHADEPSKDCFGKWEICTEETAKTFSAVAYYFGKEILNALDVPVGLIHVSWGGSTAQAWTNYNILQSTPEGQFYIEKYNEKIKNSAPGIVPRNHQSPAGLYNGMLKPLIPFGIRGAIWYQGESNTNEHSMYKNLMKTMIMSWRNEWSQDDFPFYFVQIAPFNYQKEFIGAALRDEQRRSLEISNTGMAVTMDIGNPDDIHPLNKKDVGKRLSLWALAKTYGIEDLVYSGPLYKSMQKEGKKIRVTFDHVDNGLICKGEELSDFTIAGEDRKFHQAEAIIDKNTILVSSKEVKNPLAVRFAFNNGDEPNLFNKEGLPVSTFRTDDWTIITETASVKSEYDANTESFLISIELIENAEARFTLDGKEPTVKSEIYSNPFNIADDVIIKVKVFVEGEPSLLTTETKVERHLATGKKVIYINQYHERFTGSGDLGLVNGLFGSTNYADGNWQGFQGDDLEIVINLNQSTNISSVGVNCLQDVNSWIVLPKQLKVFVSEDGKEYQKIVTVDQIIPASVTKEFIHELIAEFETTETKYIKITATNYGPLPDWHPGAGENSWLFVDEVIVK